jgi:hypothetical protein
MSIGLVASQAAGCIISSDSSQTGHVSATWHVDSVSAAGTVSPTSCPAGIDTAALYTVAATSDGTAISTCTVANGTDCFIDLFNCDDNAGISSALPAQNYLTWINLTNHDGSQIYATSTAEFVDITNVDMNFDTEILVDGGYFKLSWSLKGASSQAALTCSQTAASSAAGGSVEVASTLSSNASILLTDKFNCEDHFGYSAPLPWGSWNITIDALNSSDAAISDSTTLNNQVIGSMPNTITDLGHIVIPITGM